MQATTALRKRASLSTTGFAFHVALATEAGRRKAAAMWHDTIATERALMMRHEWHTRADWKLPSAHIPGLRSSEIDAAFAAWDLADATAADIDAMLAAIGG